MSSGAVRCLSCGRKLPPDFENGAHFMPCPDCVEHLRVFAFPALHRTLLATAAAPSVVSGEATCFYHPAKQAAVTCDGCGRFLCALCDIEVGESHRCPACLESGTRTNRLDVLQNRRVLHDSLALAIALVPMLLWPFTVVTAPAALFLVIKYWREPLSIVGRTKIRFVLAALFAVAEICGWVLFFYFIFTRGTKAGA